MWNLGIATESRLCLLEWHLKTAVQMGVTPNGRSFGHESMFKLQYCSLCGCHGCIPETLHEIEFDATAVGTGPC